MVSAAPLQSSPAFLASTPASSGAAPAHAGVFQAMLTNLEQTPEQATDDADATDPPPDRPDVSGPSSTTSAAPPQAGGRGAFDASLDQQPHRASLAPQPTSATPAQRARGAAGAAPDSAGSAATKPLKATGEASGPVATTDLLSPPVTPPPSPLVTLAILNAPPPPNDGAAATRDDGSATHTLDASDTSRTTAPLTVTVSPTAAPSPSAAALDQAELTAGVQNAVAAAPDRPADASTPVTAKTSGPTEAFMLQQAVGDALAPGDGATATASATTAAAASARTRVPDASATAMAAVHAANVTAIHVPAVVGITDVHIGAASGGSAPMTSLPASAGSMDASLAGPQIVQAIRMQWAQGSGDAVVKLNPEYLGAVTVALHVDGDAVSATVTADNPSVRDWLQANPELLRQGLAQQGLTLEHLEVKEPQAQSGGGDHRSTGHDATPDRQPQRKRGASGGGETFEVVA